MSDLLKINETIEKIRNSNKPELDLIVKDLDKVLLGLPQEELIPIHNAVLESIRNGEFKNHFNKISIQGVFHSRLTDHTVIFNAEEKKRKEEEKKRKEEEEERLRREEEERLRREEEERLRQEEERFRREEEEERMRQEEEKKAQEEYEALSESMKILVRIAKDSIDKFSSDVYKTKIHLSSDEKRELKKLYREISKICHPDKLQEDEKKYGEDIFKELGAANKAGHLYRLRELDIALQHYFEEKSKE